MLCAMAAQKSLAEWNDPRPAGRRMVLRVGVNLGDIFLQADGHVYGDGVNVAARLQTFAEPGGICVSEMVRAAVGNKLPAVFDSLGEQQFKNIAVPISVYGARLIPDAVLPEPPMRSDAARCRRTDDHRVRQPSVPATHGPGASGGGHRRDRPHPG